MRLRSLVGESLRERRIGEHSYHLGVQSGHDRRTKVIVITNKGREVSMKSMNVWEEFQKRLVRKIGKQRIEDLCREICQIIEAVKTV
mgnify:CR=1 FL=1